MNRFRFKCVAEVHLGICPMIRVTGIEEKDRILSPYFRQLHIINQQRGSIPSNSLGPNAFSGLIDSAKYFDLIDTWLDNILKAIEDYDKKIGKITL